MRPNRSALPITGTELNVIATLALKGLRRISKNGYTLSAPVDL